jgi:uncharacterized repeat protein (TIGR03833 family)
MLGGKIKYLSGFNFNLNIQLLLIETKKILGEGETSLFGVNFFMDGKNRSNIKQGFKVKIQLKKNQENGKLTKGIVKDILTKSASHPHGIKVKLISGDIGRVKLICK